MTKADTTQAADKAIAAWAAAWAESRAESIQRMLEEGWAEDGQYTDPNTVLKGRAEVAEYIVTVPAAVPWRAVRVQQSRTSSRVPEGRLAATARRRYVQK